ncbi:hypothetical protein GAY28_19155, partial [Azospirillum brasilense]|nr:hypothetical protein [Azospirillum brasilense]
MSGKDLLTRCDEAARGYEATHGPGARCLFHDLADELRRLYPIEQDVRALLTYRAVPDGGAFQGRYYDPIEHGYTTLEGITTRRLEAGKRLMAPVKGGGGEDRRGRDRAMCEAHETALPLGVDVALVAAPGCTRWSGGVARRKAWLLPVVGK